MTSETRRSTAHRFDELTHLISQIDEAADLAACNLVQYPDPEAERVLDGALAILGQRWKGDTVEFAVRRKWLRAEVLRRHPRVGRA